MRPSIKRVDDNQDDRLDLVALDVNGLPHPIGHDISREQIEGDGSQILRASLWSLDKEDYWEKQSRVERGEKKDLAPKKVALAGM